MFGAACRRGGGPGPVLAVLGQAGKEVTSSGAPEIELPLAFPVPPSLPPRLTRVCTPGSVSASEENQAAGPAHRNEEMSLRDLQESWNEF